MCLYIIIFINNIYCPIRFCMTKALYSVNISIDFLYFNQQKFVCFFKIYKINQYFNSCLNI